MARQDPVQTQHVLLDALLLELVELVVERRHLGRLEHRAEARQHLRQIWVEPRELLEGRAWLRDHQVNLIGDLVAATLLADLAGDAPLLGVDYC